MLMVNHLIGFGSFAPALTESLYDRTTGTNIGDMLANGGLAAAFDGTTSQLAANTATAGGGGTTPAYCGKTMAASHPISKVVFYGSSDAGLSSSGSAESMTVTLRGKNGAAPASYSDGTQLGVLAYTDPDNATAQTINSTDTWTFYDHVWIQVAGPRNYHLGELQIYVMT